MTISRRCFAAALSGPVLLRAQSAEPAPDPDRGLYAIWFKDPKLLDLPFIKGGQAVAQWQTVQPAQDHYDFSTLDEQLARLAASGRKATVQVNGNLHPEFLFEKVPSVAAKLSVQVRDERGTLQYWHPAYIDAYEKLLAAYAAHLKASPHRKAVLGVRLNFNALGTEHVDVPPEYRDPAAWKGGAPWTRATGAAYQARIVDKFVREFPPQVRLFARNNLFAGPNVNPAWVRLAETGQLGLFHTSSEMEPRRPGPTQYDAFVRHCRSGQTLCYAESWADSWGRHGGQTDPRWCPPAQWNYWRMLADLHCGVSFIAVYGADLAEAGNPEFRAAFEFAARYAGYHASPAAAPGAWVALRQGNALQGDYTFLMRRIEPDQTRPVEKVGPAEQRFGAWARMLAAGETARFAADARFASSLPGATLALTYLDRDAGSLELRWGDWKGLIELTGTGGWKTAALGAQPAAGPIALTASSDVALHMIEVRRVQRL